MSQKKLFRTILLILLMINASSFAAEVALQELPNSDLTYINVSIPQASMTSVEGAVAGPVESPAHIEVNIPARQMKVFYNEDLVFTFPVAVGAPGYKTPTSHREMKQIVWNPWWLPPDSPWAKNEKPVPPGPNNPLGPVKMDLGNAILFHGTNKPQSVGRAASHGCMRMRNEDAKTLAWWVQSHFTEKTDITLQEKYAKNKGSSFYVNLKTPIPVDIKYEVFEKQNEQVVLHPDVYGRVADKKSKLKEWLSQQGIETAKLSDSQMALYLSQVKRDSLPVVISDFLQPEYQPNKQVASPSIPEQPQELGAAVQTKTINF